MRRWCWVLLAACVLGGLALAPLIAPMAWRRADAIRLAIHPLPTRSGPYGVWVRTEPLLIQTPDRGPPFSTAVRIWYPTDGDGRAAAMRPQAVPSYLDRFRQVRFVPGRAVVDRGNEGGRSFDNGRGDGTTFPLIVYIPGLAGERDENSFAIANLVSHGYVVVAVHDASTPESGCVHFMPMAECGLTSFDVSSQAAFDGSLAIAGRRVTRDTVRIAGILDAIEHRQDRPGWFLRGRIDLTKVAALGYSLGGATAMQLLAVDRRIKSAVNLDGWLVGDALSAVTGKPILIINSRFPAPDSVELAKRPQAQAEARKNRIDSRLTAQRTPTSRTAFTPCRCRLGRERTSNAAAAGGGPSTNV
jgi:predicted dienelactone hydrolase